VIVDSSAIIAILTREPEALRFAALLTEARATRISAATYLETAVVIDSVRNPIVSAALDALLAQSKTTIEPVTPAQARIAREAYRNFGKGSGHPARLNFGDCFSYALAKDKAEPLLFKGTDFAATDIESAS
jgi:ribonuclease VapC